MELSPDGAGYRVNTRFARFINVPELMGTFREVADVQTAEMLNLPIPKLHEGKAQIVSAAKSDELSNIVSSLAARAQALKNGNVDPRDDNMLKITTEGRKAALDLRVLDTEFPDVEGSKVNLAVQNVYQIWQDTAADKSTQMIFCNLSSRISKNMIQRKNSSFFLRSASRLNLWCSLVMVTSCNRWVLGCVGRIRKTPRPGRNGTRCGA
jgi:hypothetical protein